MPAAVRKRPESTPVPETIHPVEHIKPENEKFQVQNEAVAEEIEYEEETAAPRRPVRRPVVQADLSALARRDEDIHVRNTLPSIAVLQIVVDGNVELSEFQPKGDPSGEDVMQLPSTYLRNAQFRKQLQKGIFEIIDSDNPDVVAAWASQRAAWDTQRAAKEASDSISVAHQPKAYSGTQCIATEGQFQCENFAVYATNYRERPPLCSKHTYLSSQYLPEETGQFDKQGKSEIDWIKVSIMGR